MTSNEDQRTAIGLLVNLSNQLNTLALALLAIEAALVPYILSNNEPKDGFKIVAISSSFFLIFSIFLGGRGISKSGSLGHNGDWNLRAGGPFFNYQAIFGIIGIILLFVTVSLSGTLKKSNIENGIEKLIDGLHNINNIINPLVTKYDSVQKDLQSKDIIIENLAKESQKLIDGLHNINNIINPLVTKYDSVQKDLQSKDIIIENLAKEVKKLRSNEPKKGR